MFKGFSSRQNLHGFPQRGGNGASNYVAYDKGGCVLWLDAADGHHLIPNTAVPSWTNLINGDTFSQVTVANQPIYRASNADFNNLPVLQFDGTDQLSSTQLSIYQLNQSPLSGSIFIVAQRVGNIVANGPTILHNGSGGSGSIIFGITSSPFIGVRGFISSGISDLSPHIIAIKPGSSGTGGVWVDGVKYSGTLDTSLINYNTIGYTAGTNSINGFIGEILCYRSVFSDSDIEDVCNALNAKYAIY